MQISQHSYVQTVLRLLAKPNNLHANAVLHNMQEIIKQLEASDNPGACEVKIKPTAQQVKDVKLVECTGKWEDDMVYTEFYFESGIEDDVYEAFWNSINACRIAENAVWLEGTYEQSTNSFCLHVTFYLQKL